MNFDAEYELTQTGIPLGYRYEAASAVPVDVRPVVAPKPISEFPKGPSGQAGPGARVGRDQRTYWCLSCETAVPTATRTWCKRCSNKRDADARRVSRAAEEGRPSEVSFPLEVLTELVRYTEAVIDTIGVATMEFDRVHMSGGAIDDLMLATKDLAGYLSREIRPAVQNAKFGTVTAEQVRVQQGQPGRVQRPRQP
ncbi:hypothetical protein [Nocardioides abyssi]|uniref:Uncharacterized protein n=1 Tax=Nocardioides abyssi TaxID=3058370 RepID=A0ABT8ESQ1_9ACTN|nr:hypothetical protein [Nocardioides abyssi]MDN4161132.1 hypothetical protein [Nocardioides abyssi]